MFYKATLRYDVWIIVKKRKINAGQRLMNKSKKISKKIYDVFKMTCIYNIDKVSWGRGGSLMHSVQWWNLGCDVEQISFLE